MPDHRSLSFVACLSALLTAACHSTQPNVTDRSAASAAELRVPDHVGYRPAPWRLTTPDALERTVLWVSHIVVMHSDSHPEQTPLRSSGWSPDRLPALSRQDAYRMAVQVRARAEAHP